MRVLAVLASLCVLTDGGLVRVPKVYNALISSDKNLAPSHTIPVVEPVIRTTALGVALPPILIQPVFEEESQDAYVGAVQRVRSDGGFQNTPTEERKVAIPQTNYQDSLYPVAIDPYFPYQYTPEQLYHTLPYFQQPIFENLPQLDKANGKENHEHFEHVANFKKNPDIPDVPPPPLPIKVRSQSAS